MQESPQIKRLDKTTARRLVSERVIISLASIIKELIENSLDARASSIEIRLRENGKDLIEVIDDGHGIREVDFEYVALPSHTSKLKDYEELSRIKTFGFKGQALSCITSMSNLTIITKHADASHGYKLVFDEYGKLVNKTPTHRSTGTTVQIQNIFHTFPVRQKDFLSNSRKHFSEMVQYIYPYILGLPHLRLVCTNIANGKKQEVLNVTSTKGLKEKIIQVLGCKTMVNTYEFVKTPISPEVAQEYQLTASAVAEEEFIDINGYISGLDSINNKLRKCYFFINERPCIYQPLEKMIVDLYKSYNKNCYPFIILKVDLGPFEIDINCHPDKRKFLLPKEKLLFAMIKSSLLVMINSPNRTSLSQPLDQSVRKRPFDSLSSRKCPSPFDDHISQETSDDIFDPINDDILDAHCPGHDLSIEEQSSKQTRRSDSDIENRNSTINSEHFTLWPPFYGPPTTASSGLESRRARETNVGSLDSDRPSGSRLKFMDSFSYERKRKFRRSDPTQRSITDMITSYRNPPDRHAESREDVHERPCTLESSCDVDGCEASGLSAISVPHISQSRANQQSVQISINQSARIAASGSVADTGIESATSNVRSFVESELDISVIPPPDNNAFFNLFESTRRESVGRNDFSLGISTIEEYELDHNMLSTESSSGISSGLPAPNSTPLVPAIQQIQGSESSLQIVPVYESSQGGSKNSSARTETTSGDTTNGSVQTVETEIRTEAIPADLDLFAFDNLDPGEDFTSSSDEEFSKFSRCEAILYGQLDEDSYMRSKDSSNNSVVGDFSIKVDPANVFNHFNLEKNIFDSLEVIGQFNAGFIIAKYEKNVFIVDQHASDERYNFEDLCDNIVLESQRLVMPIEMDLRGHQEFLLLEKLATFEKNGFKFEIDEFATPGRRVMLTHVPLSEQWTFGVEDVGEILSKIEETGSDCRNYRPSRVLKMLASRACRKSIMIKDHLTITQMEKVLRQMSNLKNPWICAHGRPTIRFLFSLNDGGILSV